jgi:hypothetical protein
VIKTREGLMEKTKIKWVEDQLILHDKKYKAIRREFAKLKKNIAELNKTKAMLKKSGSKN